MGCRDENTSGSRARNTRRIRALSALTVCLLTLGGCNTYDSFLNPSVTGRWERTPTRVPILEHLAAIEDPADQWVEFSEITREDLIPQSEVYRVGPGDALVVTIWDLIQANQAETLPRVVDPNGYIEIPQLGRIFVTGKTEKEVADAVADAMQVLVLDPTVSVVVEQRRDQTFHLMGNVAAPGTYVIPSADYRLLQGMVSAGGIPAFIREVYVIRQVPLSDDAGRIAPEAQPRLPDSGGPSGDDLLDVIDDLSSPAVMSGRTSSGLVAPSMNTRDEDPPIDLIDSGSGPAGSTNGNTQNQGGSTNPAVQNSLSPTWRFVDGEWVRETIPVTTGRTIARDDSMTPQDLRGELFTQRVIRVPTQPLLAGDARYNIVLRPGDIVNVPPAPAGNVYVDGEVNQPGVFNLPNLGRLTLTRALTSAGGLNGLAVPERVDLTRIVGRNEQATIMLNLRAIEEGTQPDVYIKPDDRINVGTNFWATPLAVIRSGFRVSYGFGFLLDRNFGNDVFGPPPVRSTRF